MDYVAVRSEFREIETRILPYIVKIDSIGPIAVARDRNISAVGSDEKCVVMVGYRQIKVVADRLTMRVGRRHRDWIVADIADGRGARDDAGMGIDAQAGRQRGREGQRVAGCGSGEVAGDIKREGVAFVGALVCDGGSGRAAVADSEIEALADCFAMGIGRRHGDRSLAGMAEIVNEPSCPAYAVPGGLRVSMS